MSNPFAPGDPSYPYWQSFGQHQQPQQKQGMSPMGAYNNYNTMFGSGQTFGQQMAGQLGGMMAGPASSTGAYSSFIPGAAEVGSIGGGGGAAAAGGGSMFGGGAGGAAGTAAMSNPIGWIGAAIAANELAGHGSSRRPDGWEKQIKFDLMGRAPGADAKALSDKWFGHDSGVGNEAQKMLGITSLRPKDMWGAVKQPFDWLGGIF